MTYVITVRSIAALQAEKSLTPPVAGAFLPFNE